MKPNHIFSVLAAGLMLAGCASETPFEGPKDKEKGSFSKAALNLKVQTDHVIKLTRAGNEVVMDTVHISFFDKNNALMDFYRYGEMPEVVTLNEGDYYVSAVYTHDGTDEHRAAAWDYPFYQGKSDIFTIEPNRITTDLGVIKCALENVMTSVVFDPMLRAHMSEEDSFVELKLNEGSDALNFTVNEEDNQNYGYFHIDGEQSLVATFKGVIDGAYTSEVKTVANIEAGNHYRITFKLHDYQGENSGSMTSDVVLDASVTKTDIDGNVSIVEAGLGDSALDENERPGEEPTEPVNPEEPVDPTPSEPKGPVITPCEGIDLDIKNEVEAGTQVEFTITSETGITGFIVVIDSNTLTPDELEGVGLTDKLDLVNPGEFEEALAGFEFPIKDAVLNQKKVEFSISGFIGLLGALGPGEHNFILTVTDSEGTTTKTLTLVTK